MSVVASDGFDKVVLVEGYCNVVRKGKQCRQRAGYGTDHVGIGPCKHHGGSTPLVRQHHKDILADRRAAAALAQFGMATTEADPETVLLDLVSEAAGNVAWLGEQVNALAEDNADPDPTGQGQAARPMWSRASTGYVKGRHLFGPKVTVDALGNEHVVGEDERAMVRLYGQWADRLAKYAKAALDAGIEKRRVEMAERQGETIVVVVNNVLVQLGLDDSQIERARVLVAEQFRALEAEG